MIYLDNAATSFPKPRSVITEQLRCMRFYAGNSGRGSHRMALAASEKIYECRERIARFFASDHPERVTFCMNTTMALNFVIKGCLTMGDHVLISDMEHNAVYRPIAKLADEGRISYDVFPTFVCDEKRSDARILSAIGHLIKPNTKMLITSHVSNLTSAVMPLEKIGELCKRRGILLVVDAAQSAGHLPIDVGRMKIDALCVPAHKGLLGPQGCGFVLWGEEIHCAETLMEGGSGYRSLDPEMPLDFPERFEAGTLPLPAIAGLCEGIREIEARGLQEIEAHERMLFDRLFERLSGNSRVKIYTPQHRGSIFLFSVEGISADEIGRRLDQKGICVRTGFHCAALGHQTLGTPTDGAIRVSTGLYNTALEIDCFVEEVNNLLK